MALCKILQISSHISLSKSKKYFGAIYSFDIKLLDYNHRHLMKSISSISTDERILVAIELNCLFKYRLKYLTCEIFKENI